MKKRWLALAAGILLLGLSVLPVHRRRSEQGRAEAIVILDTDGAETDAEYQVLNGITENNSEERRIH